MVSFLVRRHVLAIAASVLVACNGYSHEELDNNGQAGLLHLEPTRARSFTLGPDGAFCGVEPPYPEKTCSCTEEVEGLVSQRGGTVDWSIDRRLRVTEGGRYSHGVTFHTYVGVATGDVELTVEPPEAAVVEDISLCTGAVRFVLAVAETDFDLVARVGIYEDRWHVRVPEYCLHVDDCISCGEDSYCDFDGVSP